MAWTYTDDAALCPWRGCGFSCSSAAMSWQSVQRDAALDWRAASRLVTKVSNRRDNELIKPKSVGRRRDSQSAIWISFTQPKTLFYFYVGTLGWTRWWKTIPPAPSLLTPTPARSLSTRERGNCGMSRLSLSLCYLFFFFTGIHAIDTIYFEKLVQRKREAPKWKMKKTVAGRDSVSRRIMEGEWEIFTVCLPLKPRGLLGRPSSKILVIGCEKSWGNKGIPSCAVSASRLLLHQQQQQTVSVLFIDTHFATKIDWRLEWPTNSGM